MPVNPELILQKDCGAKPGQKIILTVSGGIDSVVMLHLFSRMNFHCSIAHCNFRLRGQESDDDESFVRELGEKYGMSTHVKHFDTLSRASERKISVQMAARELRYQWFGELRQELKYDYIATAHNLDDQAETFFINLLRGTGIRGLSGIKEKSGHIIRPLLNNSREEIEEYARLHELKWREDSSNSSLKYKRNRIRHQLMPLLKEISPEFTGIMHSNIRRLREAEEIYRMEIEKRKTILLRQEGELVKIPISLLLAEKHSRTVLFELLQEYGFSAAGIDDILNGLSDGESGKKYFSDSYRIVKDREYLIVGKAEKDERQRFYIDEGVHSVSVPVNLKIDVLEAGQLKIPADKNLAFLDYGKLNFPLIIRKWQQGDYFMPLGMSNLKKLSDFFIDGKFSIPEKENTWLLASGRHIVWIIGHRIDDRFKVSQETEKICRIENIPVPKT